MNNILVATFNDQKSAIEAMHKLNEIDRQDDIDLYNYLLLKRNPNGSFEYLKDVRDPDGWGTLTGTIVGSLVGVVGGPVGMLVGLFGGMTIGAITDAFRFSFDYDFIESFKDGLPAGTTTLIAEVVEPSQVFVNQAFAPLGATIRRSNVYTEQDKYFETQINELDAGIAEAEKELKEAAAEDKAAIQAKLKVMRERRDARVAEIKADMQDDIDSIKSDVERLQKKIQGKVDEVKKNRLAYKLARNQERIKKYEERTAKINAELAAFSKAAQ